MSKMKKLQFESIAECIKRAVVNDYTIQQLTFIICEYLETQNKQFDKNRFLLKCGVVKE